MRSRSITFRLALLFSTASTLVLLLVGVLIVRQVDRHFEELDIDALNGKMLLLENKLAKLRTPAYLERLGPALAEVLVGHEHLAVAVLGTDRRLLFTTPAVVFPPALLEPGATPARGRATSWAVAGRRYRGMAAALATGNVGQPPLTVVVVIDIAPHLTFIAVFQRGLLRSVFGGIALTALLSWIALHRARHRCTASRTRLQACLPNVRVIACRSNRFQSNW